MAQIKKKIICTILLIFSDIVVFVISFGVISSSHRIKNSERLFWNNFLNIWIIISIILLLLIWFRRKR
jgi:hypothetical protein